MVRGSYTIWSPDPSQIGWRYSAREPTLPAVSYGRRSEYSKPVDDYLLLINGFRAREIFQWLAYKKDHFIRNIVRLLCWDYHKLAFSLPCQSSKLQGRRSCNPLNNDARSLIYVGTRADDTIKVVHVVDPGLIYVALSYCWGAGLRSTLTKDAINSFRGSISWDLIPKILQDAISLSVKLQIP